MSDDDVSKLFEQLPDEEPPETGMAALMAAARAKAVEMAPPPRKSLWARFLDGIKAPPVLALATVVVLIGGAIIIKNHDTALDATNRVVVPEQAVAPIATPDAAMPAAHDEVPAAVAAAPEPPPTEPALAAPPPAPHVANQAPPRRRMAPSKHLENADRDDGVIGAGSVEQEVASVPPPPPPPPPVAAPTAPPPGITIATEDAPAPATKAPAAATAKGAAPSPALVEQLLHACRAAAQKRDCPTARTLATQIHDKDACFYRARVLKDADIVKCL
jgi:hypothetical protein